MKLSVYILLSVSLLVLSTVKLFCAVSCRLVLYGDYLVIYGDDVDRPLLEDERSLQFG